MGIQSNVRRILGVFLLVLPLGAGCGGGGEETAPAEQPSIGPGGPPGTFKSDSKDKAGASRASSPSTGSKSQ